MLNLERKISIEELFESQAVWPVIVVEDATNKVVSLQEINIDAFRKTLKTGQCWYFDKVNNVIYLKGEHSNEVESLKKVTLDICHARRHIRNLHYRVDIADGACMFGMSKCDFYVLDGNFFRVDSANIINKDASEKECTRIGTLLSEEEDIEHQKRFIRKK